jgi:hypothetical protein
LFLKGLIISILRGKEVNLGVGFDNCYDLFCGLGVSVMFFPLDVFFVFYLCEQFGHQNFLNYG